MHTPLYVIATLQAKPGHAPYVLALARPCIDATRREAGCQSIHLTDRQRATRPAGVR